MKRKLGKKLLRNDYSISVIIPAFNAEKTIGEAIWSVLDQSAIEHIQEIIVVNDGSTDGTAEVVDNCFAEWGKCSPSLTLLSQNNSGVASARNLGIAHASGTWIALLDSDDKWLDDKVFHQLNILHQNRDIDFLGGAINYEKTKILGVPIKNLKQLKLKHLLIKMIPQTSTALFRSDIVQRIGAYSSGRRFAEDGEFFLRISDEFNYFFDPKTVVIYGNFKGGFGEGGLSGNLHAMHTGSLKNLSIMKQEKRITLPTYFFLMVFYKLKYLRRKFLRFFG